MKCADCGTPLERVYGLVASVVTQGGQIYTAGFCMVCLDRYLGRAGRVRIAAEVMAQGWTQLPLPPPG